VDHRVERLRQNPINGSILRNVAQTFADSGFESLTSHRNVILSVLEAVLGRSFTRPTYAKDKTPKTPAMEKAEVVVNTAVVFVSAMTIFSTRLFETVAVLGVKGGSVCCRITGVWLVGPRLVSSHLRSSTLIHLDPLAKTDGHALTWDSSIRYALRSSSRGIQPKTHLGPFKVWT